MKRIGAYALATLIALLTAGAAGNYWYYYDAINVHPQSFVEKRALLEPYIQVFLPEAEGPRPAVLFFHGCGGLSENTVPRAEAATAAGYVAIVLDSLTPRQIAWQDNCDGRVLQGPERAADILVALAYARQLATVDPGQLYIVGYSHGAWTALESLAFYNALPPGLTDSPGQHLAGVKAIVAWYPYCGFAADYVGGWQPDIPVLMMLAEKDQITDPLPCQSFAEQQAAAGKSIELITYPGVSHGFDVDADWVKIYDPNIARQALQEQFAFIARPRG
ncbi:MAG: dienelactone hydrolase family protein [Halieaceae bacterium]